MNLLSSNPSFGVLKSDHIIYNLIRSKNKIGRQPTLSIVLNHPSISKEHALIEFDKEMKAFITDFNSSNGTYVNNQRIPEGSMIKLKTNDLITFGKDTTVYQFSYNYTRNNNMSSLRSSKSVKNNFDIANDVNSHHNNDSILINSNHSLYQDLYRSKGDLEVKVKDKAKEVENVTELYEQMNEKYNKLLAKHNALMLYASNIQKKNDMFEISIKEKNERITQLTSQDVSKLLQEKEEIIKLIQNENRFYSDEFKKLRIEVSNPNIANGIDQIINDYLGQILNLKKIIAEYEVKENQCSKKWNDLIKSNNSLKEQINHLQSKWNEEVVKYNALISQNDKRLADALAQIPTCYDRFNVNKEEAARFLVHQVNLFLLEKPRLINDNAMLNKRVIDLQYQNEKLKDEICKTSVKISQMGNPNELIAKIEELQDIIIQLKEINPPESKIDYENCIRKYSIQIDNKDKLIQELKEKLDKAMNSSNVFFDEREIINSVSQALRDKDELISKLKNQIIDVSWGTNNKPQI